MNAKRFVWVMLLVPFVFAGCLVGRGPHGEALLLAPPLPPLVILEDEPYYVQGGFHYHYRDGGWYYSHSRGGPWVALPRDRYPRWRSSASPAPKTDRSLAASSLAW